VTHRFNGRVAANQFAAVAVGEREEPFAEGGEPRFVRFRQRERQRERLRLRAHRGEVRQIHRERFMAERFGIDIGEEMAAFHQHVRRYRQHFARTRREQRAVVADAKRSCGGVGRTNRSGATGKEAINQRKLGEHGGGRQEKNGGKRWRKALNGAHCTEWPLIWSPL
jgi:hypothetical protein